MLNLEYFSRTPLPFIRQFKKYISRTETAIQKLKNSIKKYYIFKNKFVLVFFQKEKLKECRLSPNLMKFFSHISLSVVSHLSKIYFYFLFFSKSKIKKI